VKTKKKAKKAKKSNKHFVVVGGREVPREVWWVGVNLCGIVRPEGPALLTYNGTLEGWWDILENIEWKPTEVPSYQAVAFWATEGSLEAVFYDKHEARLFLDGMLAYRKFLATIHFEITA